MKSLRTQFSSSILIAVAAPTLSLAAPLTQPAIVNEINCVITAIDTMSGNARQVDADTELSVQAGNFFSSLARNYTSSACMAFDPNAATAQVTRFCGEMVGRGVLTPRCAASAIVASRGTTDRPRP